MSDSNIKNNEKEVIRISSPEGYKKTNNILRVSSEDMEKGEEVVILNYPRANVPDTGTLARLPFLLLSISLILLSIFIKQIEKTAKN